MTAPDAQPPAWRPYGRWIPPAFTLLGHTPKASPTGNSTFSACWECVCGDFLHVTQDGYYAGPAVERHCERAASPASAALDGTLAEPTAETIEKLANAIYACDSEPPLNARTVPERWAVYQTQARNIVWPVVAALLASTPTEED